MKALVEVLPESLTSLNIHHNSLCFEGIKILTARLSPNFSIDLSHNHVGIIGIKKIDESIIIRSSIKFKLIETEMELLTSLEDSLTQLEGQKNSLKLTGKRMSPLDLDNTINSLPSHLTYLDLSFSYIEDSGMQKLASFLNEALVYLNLIWNNIGPIGVSFLSKSSSS